MIDSKKPRGNPNLDAVRCVDTKAASLGKARVADEFAISKFKILRKAATEIDPAMTHPNDQHYSAIASWLNENNEPTMHGGKWTHRTVKRLQQRLAGLAAAGKFLP